MKTICFFFCCFLIILPGADKLTEKGVNRLVNRIFSKRKPRAKDIPVLSDAKKALIFIHTYEAELKTLREAAKGRGAKNVYN